MVVVVVVVVVVVGGSVLRIVVCARVWHQRGLGRVCGRGHVSLESSEAARCEALRRR